MGVPTLNQFDEDTCRELVYWRARGFSQEEAAGRAGVPLSPRLSRFFRSVPYATAMREALRERMELELAPKAIQRLEGILDDTKASPKVVVDASKAVLDRSGYGTSAKAADPLAEKSPRDMTPAELAELIERLERQKSGLARVVNDPPATDSFSANFLD